MAIMAIYDGAGFTRRDYDHIRAAIGWDADPAAGCYLHLLGADPDGLFDVQVWESEDLLNHYIETRFLPAFDALRLQRPPNPRVLELHSGAQTGDAEQVVPLLAASLIPA